MRNCNPCPRRWLVRWAAAVAAGTCLSGVAVVWAAPTEESAAERRAVRGSAVESGAGPETPELRELRQFESEAFPRYEAPALVPGWGGPGAGDAETATAHGGPAAPPLGGRWDGSGDVPPALRTPPTARDAERAIPPKPEAEWLRALRSPEIPVRWDARVLRYLEYFKSDPRGHALMAGWLRRMGRYAPLFERVLEREGLPKDLVYLAMVESGFEPGAVSHAGAGGVWQFIPGAARAYGLEVSYWVDRRRDPERAAEAAARMLKDLYVRFGSWHLAFAAYNAGYGAVLKSISRFNSNDYWELCRHEAGLPWETTLYVPKILAAAVVGHNRATFGFADVSTEPAWTYDVVEVPPGTPLTTVARAAGATLDALVELNPELVRGRTPPDRSAFAVRVPTGSGPTCAQALRRPQAGSEKVDRVVLRFGETLDDLARARGVSVRELRRLNGLRDGSELRGGTTILVPAGEARVGATTVAGDEANKDEPTLVAVPDRTFAYAGRERVFYRTRDGDNLEELADVFQVTPDEICEWNSLDGAAKLQPRMVLQLFVAKDFDRSGVALLDSARLRIVTLGSEEFFALSAALRGKTRLTTVARPGDTLAKIARRYGLAAADLARINRVSAAADLTDGQRVVVYSPTPELPREVTAGRTAAAQRRPAAAAVHTTAVVRRSAGAATSTAAKPVVTPATKVAKPAANRPAAPTKAATASKPAAAPAGKPSGGAGGRRGRTAPLQVRR